MPREREPSKSEKSSPPPGLRRTITRADLSQCLPAKALSRTYARNHWQLVDYETQEGVRGVMAYAYPDDACPELTLPLNVEGVHRVYLGINYSKSAQSIWPAEGQLEVKLSDDLGFRRVAAEAGSVAEAGAPRFPSGQDLYKSIQETYWRTADLSRRALVFRQPQAPYNLGIQARHSNLAYVRLEPLTEAEIRSWKSARPGPATRRMAAIYCTAHLTGSTDGTATFHPTTQQWFRDEFAPYVDSDVGLFIFEALRGNFCLYKTRIGDVGSENGRWGRHWVDPLSAFTRLAHRNGMEILAALRMIGPQYPMNRTPLARARHYWQHPEWAKLDSEGIPLSNWSIAYPQVRQYWLNLLKETLGYGIDGIQLHLNRSTPFVMYEAPVVKAFQEKYGKDPRDLPETEPRIIAHRAEYLTQFVREVRALLNEKPGRKLGATVFGPTKESEQDEHFKLKSCVCDVETWLKEGLVDYVMPSPYIDTDVLRKWRELCGHGAHLWPDLMPRFQPAESYAKLARKYYEAGADGFCLWDAERRAPHSSEWAAVRLLGHQDLLDRIIAEGPSWHRSVDLRTLGGFSAEHSFRDG
jgi:hypothetical protein